jgi:poly-D-alanine transfer protein DltD
MTAHRKVQINGGSEWVDFDQLKNGDIFIIDEDLNMSWKEWVALSDVFLNDTGIKTIHAEPLLSNLVDKL